MKTTLVTVDGTGVEVRTLAQPTAEFHGEAHVEIRLDGDDAGTAKVRLSRSDARLLALALTEAAS